MKGDKRKSVLDLIIRAGKNGITQGELTKLTGLYCPQNFLQCSDMIYEEDTSEGIRLYYIGEDNERENSKTDQERS